MSLWRLQKLLVDWIIQAVKGLTTLAALRENWHRLLRHLCDSPRKRRSPSLSDLTPLAPLLND